MSNNKKIRNATAVKGSSITFKSKLEKTFYNILKEQGLNPQYEPKTFELWPSFNPLTPFYDKETPSQYDKRIKNKDESRYKKLVLKNNKVVGIRYTPDFYFKYNNLHVYIEAKGIENDVHYIKKKLFRKYLDDRLINYKEHSIYFEVYSKKQLFQAINIIKQWNEEV